jgi:hypothetical protein
MCAPVFGSLNLPDHIGRAAREAYMADGADARAPRRRVYAKQGRQTRPGAVTSKASKHWRCIRHSDLSGRPHHSLAARSRQVESDLTGMLPLRRDARARPIPRPACPGPQPYRPQRAVSELDVAAAKRTPAGRQPHRDRPETFFRSHYCPFYAARVCIRAVRGSGLN